eukprot:3949458-Prymnesium_polylepis.1
MSAPSQCPRSRISKQPKHLRFCQYLMCSPLAVKETAVAKSESEVYGGQILPDLFGVFEGRSAPPGRRRTLRTAHA